MEKISAVPLVSVGKVKFGMIRDEVREQYELKEEFYKDMSSKIPTDDFGFCHVYYDAEGKCEAIEVFDAEVYIGERKIFPASFEEAKNIEKSLEDNDEGMLSIPMSIGIYAPDGDMESILFGLQGYYE